MKSQNTIKTFPTHLHTLPFVVPDPYDDLHRRQSLETTDLDQLLDRPVSRLNNAAYQDPWEFEQW